MAIGGNIHYMDKFSIPLSHLPRRFPGPPELAVAGNVPAKRERVLRPFDNVNFSCVLSGSGHYTYAGHRHRVIGPAVFCQWPGPVMDYAADHEWHELFLIYPPESEAHWRRVGFLDPERRPVWHLADSSAFHTQLEELVHLVQHDPARTIDRIDRLAERVILESLLGAEAPTLSGAAAAVARIRRQLDQHPLEDHDVHALAADEGLSASHFRRLWQQQVGMPPARYLAQLRLRRAARALATSDAPVASIAADVGFGDPLHFSRRFRQFFATSPTRYRQRHRPSEFD